MGRINRITQTKAKIESATQQLQQEINFESSNLEWELSPETMVYVEMENKRYDSYEQLALLSVEVIKDGEKRETYLPNISRMIFRKLEREIRRFNREEFRDKAEVYDLQKRYADC